MNIFPAIDLVSGKAVRLFKGDYDKMTVYNDNPLEVANEFKNSGAEFIHLVDLEGAKSGETPNFSVIKSIAENSGLFTEVGGGIRSLETIKRYIDAGVNRCILGTAAVEDEEFLKKAVEMYGEKIAVGVDIKDGFVATHGWTEKTELECFSFCSKMQDIGVKTLICTDISKDGAMQGTNHELYRELTDKFNIDIIASGGVSSLDDIKKLRKLNIYGAIIGKAYYTRAVNLKDAIEVAK